MHSTEKHPTADHSKQAKPPQKLEPPKPTKRKPTTKKFTVTVRRIATIGNEFTVEAKDKAEAERQAVEQAKKAPFEAVVQVEVVKTR